MLIASGEVRYPLSFVFDLIKGQISTPMQIDGMMFGFGQRNREKLRMFHKLGQTCYGCGVVGTHFRPTMQDGFWHFGLYTDSGERMTLDHIVPRSKCPYGSRNDINNLRPLCLRCNRLKDNMSIDQFLDMVAQVRLTPRFRAPSPFDPTCYPSYGFIPSELVGLVPTRSRDSIWYGICF
jgi:hypothetical protein